ncbi:MAG: NADP-dependent isocitrate dehydrogenase [Candidatus Azotimanducaceae bacterium WSBS_2022_MAG_OTU7]
MNELTNQSSHFYLRHVLGRSRCGTGSDSSLKERFRAFVYILLHQNEDTINEELLAAQGEPIDVGGYYSPDPGLTSKAMRPSPTFNAALEALVSQPESASGVYERVSAGTQLSDEANARFHDTYGDETECVAFLFISLAGRWPCPLNQPLAQGRIGTLPPMKGLSG